MTTPAPQIVYDVVIVGGGPAGLSAALVLARARRRVLVLDSNNPRNAAARAVGNYLTRDGISPQEIRRLGRDEAAGFGAELRDAEVLSGRCVPGGFEVETAAGERFAGRKLLLATGVRDELPPVRNLREFYGLGVHHCPYCDGWHYRDKRIVSYGLGRPGLGLALSLLTWSRSITLCTDGAKLGRRARRDLETFGLAHRPEPILRLEGADGEPRPGRADRLARVIFTEGPPLEIDALFFNTGQVQRSNLPMKLGCRVGPAGGVLRDRRQRTGIPGLFLAGDASRDVQFVIVAAAEGAKAGVAINAELQREDRDRATRAS
ncbi:MAG TPA: NAD(P)/FAD-dependent oxidoreductase [Phycisphaerales bacterium]|nr:NAD(P)/FAD-dependent oxidoreductase [Phycisphaerales bacterium]